MRILSIATICNPGPCSCSSGRCGHCRWGPVASLCSNDVVGICWDMLRWFKWKIGRSWKRFCKRTPGGHSFPGFSQVFGNLPWSYLHFSFVADNSRDHPWQECIQLHTCFTSLKDRKIERKKERIEKIYREIDRNQCELVILLWPSLKLNSPSLCGRMQKGSDLLRRIAHLVQRTGLWASRDISCCVAHITVTKLIVW